MPEPPYTYKYLDPAKEVREKTNEMLLEDLIRLVGFATHAGHRNTLTFALHKKEALRRMNEGE